MSGSWRYRLQKWAHPVKYRRLRRAANRVPGCTCALGNSHKVDGEYYCFCTTTVPGCRIHRDSETGQQIAAVVTAWDESR